MANQYKVEKLPELHHGILNVYVVRNKSTGMIKYAMHERYNADDLCKFANGKSSRVTQNHHGVLTQAQPARYGIPCEQIEA
jgi:hypothetical protein